MAETRWLTEEDVERFRGKLEAWGAQLDDAERAVLQLVLVRAFPEADVEGYALPVSPRDPASGLPTGRRMQGPFTIAWSPAGFVGQPYAVGGTDDDSL
ncbi:MAG: hypothetical protein MUF83_06270 [Acidimicrobiales bacterium]|jgi:hypothetical protein|nr:hypothetical protein [Acidimicrobiales bacterium]